MIKKETKESVRFYADIAVILTVIGGIIFGIIQIYSWSQDYKLSSGTLEKQEQEKNMPPTIFLIPNIAGTSENFSLNPCILLKRIVINILL